MTKHWIGNAALMALCACVLTVPAWGQEFPVAAKTLKNGMKVLVQTDHSIPNVALYIFYRIGSRNEGPGTTGISHFFEHMALPLIYDIEADRIQNLSFEPQKIKSEREVVASERRLRTDNDNGGLLDEQLWATAYIAHPYQWPVVGWMSDIEHWTMEQLKHHFEMGYAPNNATMVVTGDVSPEEIFALCEKYIEPIPSHAPPPAVTTLEPEQLGERRAMVRKASQLPLVLVAYHIPKTNSPDYYAINVCGRCCSRGRVRECTSAWWIRTRSR